MLAIEDNDAKHDDFLQDNPADMTYGRRIAMIFMKYNWYAPKRVINAAETSHNENTVEAPFSLEKGWAFFEHSVLPRYGVDPHFIYPKSFLKRLYSMHSIPLKPAEPGDNTQETKLYSSFFTPLKSMGNFSEGVGLYFSILRACALLMLISALIHIPNLKAFASTEYSSYQVIRTFSNLWMQTSAVCEDHLWVPCPNCHNMTVLFDGYETGASPDNKYLTFTKRHTCDFGNHMWLNYYSLVFLIISFILLYFVSNRIRVSLDEAVQTAVDYSVIVENPPEDAIDPEEWRFFFESVTDKHVTVCTVAINNDVLLQTLVERRVTLGKLRNILPAGAPIYDLNYMAKIAAEIKTQRNFLQKAIALLLHPLGIGQDVASLHSTLVAQNLKVRSLSQTKYTVTKIFVTFETESAQRTALSTLSVGKLAIIKNNIKALERKFLFRSKYVLDVREPEEPSSIRWLELNAGWIQVIRSTLFVSLLSLATLIICFITIYMLGTYSDTDDPKILAYAISFLNTTFPMFAKVLTNIEIHKSESTKQSSILSKIILFLWINTAIVPLFVVPFTSTINSGVNGLIGSVHSIFVAEITTTSGLQLLDIAGNFKRHILAPRAKSMAQMYKQFEGTTYSLGDKSANMTKIMFLTFCYSIIYPFGFFMSSFALLIDYFKDAYSIMFSYSPAAKVGKVVSRASLGFFFPIMLVFYSFYSYYHVMGFPFDNVCVDDNIDGSKYFGTYIIPGDGANETITLSSESQFYIFCNRDKAAKLRILLAEYLSWDQEKKHEIISLKDEILTTQTEESEKKIYMSKCYLWTGTAILAVLIFSKIYQFTKYVLHFFKSTYCKPRGRDMKINYTDVEYILAYIPQILIESSLFPLIGCEIGHLDDISFNWKDPENDYEYYSLAKDVQEILASKSDDSALIIGNIFSVVKFWSPN